MKSLKIRLRLNTNQKLILETLSNEHRILYNHLLGFVKNSKTSDFKQINEQYKDFRIENLLTIKSKSAQNTSRSFINNIKSFYALRKKDNNARFPYKFVSWKYFKSFTLDWNNGSGGFKLKNDQLILNLNDMHNKLIIDIPSDLLNEFKISEKTIKTITFKREVDRYYLICVYSEESSDLIVNDNFVSLDLGITNLYTLFSDTIDNRSLINAKFLDLTKRIQHVNSIMDKKKKGSKSWKKINKRFLRLKRKLSNKLKDFQHKVSKELIMTCKENNIASIICGDIKVKKVINKDNHGIKSTNKNLGLSRFKTFLKYKCKNEGIGFFLVNEAYTSQTNCLTGKREFESDLSNRFVEIKEGTIISRDLNSAINIAKKLKGKWLPQPSDWSFDLKKMYMNNFSKLIYI